MTEARGRQPPAPPVTAALRAELDAYLQRYCTFVPDDSRLLPLPRVVAQIARALRKKRQFSLVRLGDGEGGCLFGVHPDFPGLAAHVAGQCLARHFGPRDWSAADIEWFARDIGEAALGADVVTFARSRTVFHKLMLSPIVDLRGMIGATWADIWLSGHRQGLAGRVYRNGYLHRDLLPFLPDLIRGQDVVLVSSLGAGFAQHFGQATGAARVADCAITGQWSNGDDGPPLYPDGLSAVRARLDRQAGAGRLVLVAAGLAAKGLCAHAARQGAVALDVGSVMDVWAGRAVRPYHSGPFVEKHRL